MLKPRIQDEMKAAMKGGNKPRLGVIRLLMAAIKQREVDERVELDDTQVLVVLDKMVKQRRDSIRQYEDAHRQDLADQEKFEITVLQEFLPAAMTEDEILGAVNQAILASAATSMQDMGKVMAQLKAELQGRADIGAVSAMVKQRLAG